jgi:hypothetical protein
MNYFSKFIFGEKLDRNEVLNHKRVAAADGRKPANQFTAAKQNFRKILQIFPGLYEFLCPDCI